MKYKNWTPKQLSNALSINQEIKMPINGISGYISALISVKKVGV